MKLLKVFQYAYIFFAALFTYDAFTYWSTDRNRSYLSLALAGMSVFMYFFRKRFRQKIQERQSKR